MAMILPGLRLNDRACARLKAMADEHRVYVEEVLAEIVEEALGRDNCLTPCEYELQPACPGCETETVLDEQTKRLKLHLEVMLAAINIGFSAAELRVMPDFWEEEDRLEWEHKNGNVPHPEEESEIDF